MCTQSASSLHCTTRAARQPCYCIQLLREAPHLNVLKHKTASTNHLNIKLEILVRAGHWPAPHLDLHFWQEQPWTPSVLQYIRTLTLLCEQQRACVCSSRRRAWGSSAAASLPASRKAAASKASTPAKKAPKRVAAVPGPPAGLKCRSASQRCSGTLAPRSDPASTSAAKPPRPVTIWWGAQTCQSKAVCETMSGSPVQRARTCTTSVWVSGRDTHQVNQRRPRAA